ncbi:MAG: hypothetical protein LBH62_07890 [Nitrososphaerota archaeon]|jgi:hypothetical protein|nr:hypothetical protein [Nitrososphaerota archaeon]
MSIHEYVQLKTELNECVRDRNNLNTFTIGTFVAALAVAYEYIKSQPCFFLFAHFLMIPLLWRIMNYKRTEYRLSNFLQEKFEDQWEKIRSNNNSFYFEFFTLSLFLTVITGCFLREALCNLETIPVACVTSSVVVTLVILFLSYKSYRLSTENCNESWWQLLLGCDK